MLSFLWQITIFIIFQNTVTRSQGDLEVQLEEYKAKMNGATSELSGERKKSAKQQILQSRLETILLVQFFKINQNTMKHKIGNLFSHNPKHPLKRIYQKPKSHSGISITVLYWWGKSQKKSKSTFSFRMQKELTGLLNFMQEPKSLREAVSTLCKKYGKSAEMTAAASIEEENENKKAMEEILRQKAFLERLVCLFLWHFTFESSDFCCLPL